jgi:cyanosortase A-associated protein
VAWRIQNGGLELATLAHPSGQLTVTDGEYGSAIHRENLTLANFARWFVGQAKLRDRRAVLVYLQIPGAKADQVQTFVAIVLQVAKLTAEKF